MNAQGNLLDRLFDPAFAESEMRRGTGQALRPDAVTPWTERATERIITAVPGMTFTADDVVEVVGLPTDADLSARCNNALGGLFMSLARQGVIRPVGYAKSARVSSRGRVVRVWQRVANARVEGEGS
ncbi:MAG: hypothetical protein ABFE13_11900 [Phycisphaerales bacterium]